MPDKLGVKLFSEKQTKFDFLLRIQFHFYIFYTKERTLLNEQNYAPVRVQISMSPTQIMKISASRRKWEAKVTNPKVRSQNLDLPSCTHPGGASNCQIYRLDCSTARKVFPPPAGCCVLAHGSVPRRTCNASRNHGWL